VRLALIALQLAPHLLRRLYLIRASYVRASRMQRRSGRA
jgi:hypothetical protein